MSIPLYKYPVNKKRTYVNLGSFWGFYFSYLYSLAGSSPVNTLSAPSAKAKSSSSPG